MSEVGLYFHTNLEVGKITRKPTLSYPLEQVTFVCSLEIQFCLIVNPCSLFQLTNCIFFKGICTTLQLIYIYIYIYIYMCVCVCVNIYIYIYIYIFINIFKYIDMCVCVCVFKSICIFPHW